MKKSLFFISGRKTSNDESENQRGEGSFQENSEDFYDHIASKVAQKISSQSSFTKLFQPSEASTSTLVTVASPSTKPPSSYANPILKSQEHDTFGELIITITYKKKTRTPNLRTPLPPPPTPDIYL